METHHILSLIFISFILQVSALPRPSSNTKGKNIYLGYVNIGIKFI